MQFDWITYSMFPLVSEGRTSGPTLCTLLVRHRGSLKEVAEAAAALWFAAVVTGMGTTVESAALTGFGGGGGGGGFGAGMVLLRSFCCSCSSSPCARWHLFVGFRFKE